jgi:hypothetical protein
MILDLDRLLAVEEPSPDGDRIFHFDVFISHRRFDLPAAFLESLSDLGVIISWDNDLDLRDRRIIHAVSRAMECSRYIALYVSEQYTDSPWCKAEYLSARQFELRFGYSRVLVILESARSTSNLPSALASQPTFLADEPGTATLAAYLISGNSKSKCDQKLLEAKNSSKGHLGPDTDLLETAEQLNLLEQRLQYWLEVGGIPSSVSELGRRTRQVMQLTGTPYTELEDILRDVKRYTLRSTINFAPTEEHTDAALQHLVGIGELVVQAFDNPITRPDADRSSEWLYDFILLPLLLPIMRDSMRRLALAVYRDICLRLETTSLRAHVPVYRMVAEAVALYPGNVDSILHHALVRLLQAEETET